MVLPGKVVHVAAAGSVDRSVRPPFLPSFCFLPLGPKVIAPLSQGDGGAGAGSGSARGRNEVGPRWGRTGRAYPRARSDTRWKIYRTYK